MFTAIAMVPLLVIRTMVMIAIRIRGMRFPPISNANVSLTFGQGTVVDIRTFMYEVRKQVKMKVSLRRKIHIIALPQGTGNAFLSPDQSATTPGNPGSAEVDASVLTPCSAIWIGSLNQVDNSTANRTSHTSSR